MISTPIPARRFWLGTHVPSWLPYVNVPMFVSHRTLSNFRTLPRANHIWALDSGGFSELSMYGEWRTTAKEYARAVRIYSEDVGNLVWAAPQDWMCESHIVEKTGLSVREHQRRTVENFIELRMMDPDLPYVPVLQGFEIWEYLQHLGMYYAAGIRLHELPFVGVGSVCRRQNTEDIRILLQHLKRLNIRVHGFGMKTAGLRRNLDNDHLVSADSLAWSFAGRRSPPLPGHTHMNCANCLEFALLWRNKLPQEWIKN